MSSGPLPDVETHHFEPPVNIGEAKVLRRIREKGAKAGLAVGEISGSHFLLVHVRSADEAEAIGRSLLEDLSLVTE